MPNYLLKADAIVGYTYRAEILCPTDTIKALIAEGILADEIFVDAPESPGFRFVDPTTMAEEEVLDLLAKDLILDRSDEHSFDTDYFPKIVFAVQVDGDERCDHCGDSLI